MYSESNKQRTLIVHARSMTFLMLRVIATYTLLLGVVLHVTIA